ncbi:hypothetical protein QZP89_19380 [Citrobacter werkmanii]|uniref:hypothetical protein n=1 Tax=Citrobacter werkmanii TaxID=67827 RepID=UPI0026508DC4|nr:hypothetical protein [Citrobacter werkmanii]MDN8553969.1 hypothetical protein [Citrobacter werkmanii]
MSLPTNFSFFSKLLAKDNFLTAFNQFNNNILHSTPEVYLTKTLLNNRISRNTKSQYCLYNNREAPKLAFLSEKSEQVEINTITFLSFDKDGYPLFKWHDAIKNESLIYSRFIHQAIKHYYVIAYMDRMEHVDINNNDSMKTWHARAKNYRRSIIG